MRTRSRSPRRPAIATIRPLSLLTLLASAVALSAAIDRGQAQGANGSKNPLGFVAPRGDPARYALELVSLRAEKTWFAGLGDRDAVSLSLTAFDGDTGSTVVVLTKIRNGQTLPLNFKRLFGPKSVNGQIRVLGDLTIAHPQKFANMKKAVVELYEASGAIAETVGDAKGDQDLILVSKVMKKDQVEKLVADVSAELIKAVGRVACGGANPITISMDNANTLSAAEIAKLAGGPEFKLLSFHKGAQAHSCFRNIIYDPISARIIRK